eukprot:TRINITY_DN4495_c0_g1_i1.p1 TRINITY_DN4495_c0_g1~~TRINITY_DN4495_c0_g1_i1.p1  ORF type:complete len:318 (+),score=110.39 TRINITY_DN4495_c0_g1_i1:130-954(+)
MKLLEWKKDYRKYKPMTQPKKCVSCQQKRDVQSYHIICAPCAQAKHLCGKCRAPCEEYVVEFDAQKKEAEEKLQFEAKLKAMKERERRAVLREMAQDEETEESSSEELDEKTQERRQKAQVKTIKEKKEWTYEGEYSDSEEEGRGSNDSEDMSDDEDSGEEDSGEEDDDEDEESDDWLAQASVPKDGQEKNAEAKESFDEDSNSIDDLNFAELKISEPQVTEPKAGEPEVAELKSEAAEPKSETAAPRTYTATPNVNTEDMLSGIVKGFKFGSS